MLYCIEGKYQTEEEEKEEKEEKEEEPIFGRHGVAHRQTSYWPATCSPDNANAVKTHTSSKNARKGNTKSFEFDTSSFSTSAHLFV